MALKDRLGILQRLPKGARTWLLLIPIFIVAGLIYSLVLRPKASGIEKTKRSISQVQSQILAERRQLTDFEPLSDKEMGLIKTTNKGISSLTKALGTIDQVYIRLTQQAKNCKLSGLSVNPNYTPTEEEKGARFADIEADMSLVKVTFYSDLESLGCFLNNIGKDRDTLIESLTITRELPKPKTETLLRIFAKKPQ
ncbi:MAG: hypothetical protein V3W51_05455 [Candidatus Brocadiales bacterium]